MSTATQRLVRLEKSMHINAQYNASKLREFIGHFPRHTIRRPIRPEHSYRSST
jgi:hypothetical protein